MVDFDFLGFLEISMISDFNDLNTDTPPAFGTHDVEPFPPPPSELPLEINWWMPTGQGHPHMRDVRPADVRS